MRILLALLFCVSALGQTQQLINVGTSANDGSGDTLRGAAIKINTNFFYIYQQSFTNTSAFSRTLLTNTSAGLWRVGLGLDSASPGSTGTNILASATPGAVRVILGLDEGAPGAFGTNVLTIATAAEARALLGLNPGAPGAMGTNLLTAVSASAARTLLDVVARDGGASTNQQALNPTLSFQIGLGSLQFSDTVGDAQTIMSNQLNAASTAWPVLFDYTGVAATNMAPRDQDVLNLATGKRAFVVLANGFATNLTQYVSGKGSGEDVTLTSPSWTNYWSWSYNNDGSYMWPKISGHGGAQVAVTNISDYDVLNWGTAYRHMPPVLASISDLQLFAGSAPAVFVSDTNRGGLFTYSGSALTHDGGSVFTATGRGTGYWVRQPQDKVLHSKWFSGATFTDLLSLQQASSDQWTTIRLYPDVLWTAPTRFYPITVPVIIEGATSPRGSNPTTVTNTITANPSLSIRGSDVVIKNLLFKNGREQIGFTEWLTQDDFDIERITIQDCVFDSRGYTGYNMIVIGNDTTTVDPAYLNKTVRNLTIKDCEFYLDSPGATYAIYPILLGIPHEHTTISGCRFAGGTKQIYSLMTGTVPTDITPYIRKTKIVGNVFGNVGGDYTINCISASGEGVTIANNTYTNIYMPSLTGQHVNYLQVRALRFENNIFTDVAAINLYSKGNKFAWDPSAYERAGYGAVISGNYFSTSTNKLTPTLVEFDGEDALFSNNDFELRSVNTNGLHLDISSAYDPSTPSSQNITLSNNRFYRGEYAVRLFADNTTVWIPGFRATDNRFTSTAWAFKIHATIKDAVFSGNTMEDSYSSNQGGLISFFNSTYSRGYNVQIVRNQTYPGRESKGFKYGVFCAASVVLDNVVVEDNTFSTTADSVGDFWSTTPTFTGTPRVRNNIRQSTGVAFTAAPNVTTSTSATSPENSVQTAQKGSIAQVQTGEAYVKTYGTSTNGWARVFTEDKHSVSGTADQMAVEFDGASGTRASIATGVNINTDPYTLFVTWCPIVMPTPTTQPLVGIGSGASFPKAAYGTVVYYDYSGDRLYAHKYGSTTSNYRYIYVSSFRQRFPGGIYHIAHTRSGTVAKIYMNGEEMVTTGNTNGTPPTWDSRADSDYFHAGVETASTSLIGLLKSAGMFNVALTQSQIRSLMLYGVDATTTGYNANCKIWMLPDPGKVFWEHITGAAPTVSGATTRRQLWNWYGPKFVFDRLGSAPTITADQAAAYSSDSAAGGGGTATLFVKDEVGTLNELRMTRGSTALTDATDTKVVYIPVANDSVVGGTINYTIFGTTATTNQTASGVLTYSATAIGTDEVVQLNDVKGTLASQPSGSILTWTWTGTFTTNNVLDLKLNADTDLTSPSPFKVIYTIIDNSAANINPL